MRQGHPITVPVTGNAEYPDVNLDWLSSLAGASHYQHPPNNPTILVSQPPPSATQEAFSGPLTAPLTAPPTPHTTSMTVAGSGYVPYHVPGPSFNPKSRGTSMTPVFSSTPSSFDLSASPALTQHSPAVPPAVRPLTDESEGEHGPDLVALFSQPPSGPCGNFAVDRPYSKEIPRAPLTNSLLTLLPPLPPPAQPVFPGHNHPSTFRVQDSVPPRSSAQAPYATGRKEVRFHNQKKVNVVEDMCKRFPEESDLGKLLKRICATVWYQKGELEPAFGEDSQAVTSGLALRFEAGQSILLGFIGIDGACLYCRHTSSKRDRIVAHVREHLGLRPFVCIDEKCPCKHLPVYVYLSRLPLSSRVLKALQAACFRESRGSHEPPEEPN